MKLNPFKSSVFVSVFGIIIVYFLLNKWAVIFDHTAYYYAIKSWILISVKPSLYLIMLLAFVLLIFKKGRNLLSVKHDFPKEVTRGLAIFTVLVAWYYLFYDFNFYANNWHLLDRFLVLITAVLSVRYPVLTILFVGQIYLVDFQFNFPLGGSKLLDKSMVLEFLKIWSSFFIFSLIYIKISKNKSTVSPQSFYIILVLFYSFFYFVPGLQKVILSGDLNWPFDNEIIYNLLSIKNKGWLNNAPQFLVDFHFWYFKTFGTVGQIAVLFLELFALFIMFNKKIFKLFIILIIVFHFHVFWLNGALFWLWILGGIFIYKVTTLIDKKYFNFKMIGFTILFYLGAFLGINTANLGWYDSPLDNYFEIEVETLNGENKKISLGNFQPYTLHLQYGNFLTTISSRNIYPGFLILNKEIFEEVITTPTDSILQLIEEKGIDRYSYEMEKNLFRFFDCYIHNSSPNPSISNFLDYIQPPNYWNAHLTDGLENIKHEEIKILRLFHCCVKREINGNEKLLWRKNVCEIKKGDRYLN